MGSSQISMNNIDTSPHPFLLFVYCPYPPHIVVNRDTDGKDFFAPPPFAFARGV